MLAHRAGEWRASLMSVWMFWRRTWKNKDYVGLFKSVNVGSLKETLDFNFPPEGAREFPFTLLLHAETPQQNSLHSQVLTSSSMHIFLDKSKGILQDVSLAAAAVWLKTSITPFRCVPTVIRVLAGTRWKKEKLLWAIPLLVMKTYITCFLESGSLWGRQRGFGYWTERCRSGLETEESKTSAVSFICPVAALVVFQYCHIDCCCCPAKWTEAATWTGINVWKNPKYSHTEAAKSLYLELIFHMNSVFSK